MRSTNEATREVGGLVGAVLFGGAAVMELVRLVELGTPWPGFTSGIDAVFGSLAIALWVASAYVLGRRMRRRRLVPLAGAGVLLAYGVLGTMGRSHFGIVYVVFALTLLLLERIVLRRMPATA